MGWVARFAAQAAFAVLVGIASPANALCYYSGAFDTKTTDFREFRDSKWVVRARVIAADYHWANAGESWVVYSLKSTANFKGGGPVYFQLFTFRDSGGFYLDANASDPDFDREYLLFLVPQISANGVPPAARTARIANYNCGRSRLWSEVSSVKQDTLIRLSRRR